MKAIGKATAKLKVCTSMHSILLVSLLQERACNKLTSFRRYKDREKTRTDWKRRGSNRDEQEPRTLNININSEALKNLNTRTVSQNSKELNHKSQDNDTVCQKNVTVQIHMTLMLLFKKFIYFVAVTTDLFSFFQL